MALWYETGNGWHRTFGFAKRSLGADLYLCCPGPSLKDVDPESLKRPGVYAMAINTAYPHIKPNVWLGMDTAACFDKGLWLEPFPKILRSHYKEDSFAGQKIKDFPSMYFADIQEASADQMFHRRAHDVSFIWNHNTFILALHFAVWMGAKRIHLVGCDFGGKQDYYDDRVLDDFQRDRNQRLYRKIVGLLKNLRSHAKANGIEIISCTADSPANEYLEYIPIDEALERSGELVPNYVSDEVLYTLDAHKCRWKAVGAGDGVITGADSNHEWLLPWWYENLKEHNKEMAIVWCDFGMSPIMRMWCEERGRVINIAEQKGKVWHRKPFAVLASPFKRSIWIDADCEVRGDLSPMFEYADQGLGLTEDPITRFCPQPGALATGVIVCAHGEPAIEEWAKEILLREHRGDQEALNAISDRLGDRIKLMPGEFQGLRLMPGDHSKDLIMHWTGEEGKIHITNLKTAI